jgi:hypothetical protein
MDMELANRLYVFCPDAEEGIEFIIQEIPEAVQKFSGSLREGQFLTSGYKPIKWDEKVNGDISGKKTIGYSHDERVRMYDDGYKASTIIVDKFTFASLLMQIKNPTTHSYNGYKLFELPRQNKNNNNINKVDLKKYSNNKK